MMVARRPAQPSMISNRSQRVWRSIAAMPQSSSSNTSVFFRISCTSCDVSQLGGKLRMGGSRVWRYVAWPRRPASHEVHMNYFQVVQDFRRTPGLRRRGVAYHIQIPVLPQLVLGSKACWSNCHSITGQYPLDHGPAVIQPNL